MAGHTSSATKVSATAPGKVILFGEHAVVYGRPAIAVPLTHLRAKATIQKSANGSGVRLVAPDLGIERDLAEAGPDDAIALAVRKVQLACGLEQLPAITVMITSDIPIAGGLGSGASITAAIIRALARFLELDNLASDQWVSDLTYEVEKIHHGTPSGIDNTVVSYEKPVYFMRRQPQNLIETIAVRRPMHMLVGDTGLRSSTKLVVGDVRRLWQVDRLRLEDLFDGCGAICKAALAAIEAGDYEKVGSLMNDNHALLVDMTVSSAELDRLVNAANAHGALGAKLSGAGRGGNMIALVMPDSEDAVRRALLDAGARHVYRTIIDADNGEK